MGKIDDLAGRRFGYLIVNKFLRTSNAGAIWRCICDCGNVKDIEARNLKGGLTKSCGCLHKEIISKIGKEKAAKLEGLRFGRLLVINRVSTKGGHSTWNCLCDCGKTIVVSNSNLKQGNVKSCGCLSLNRIEHPALKRLYYIYLKNARTRSLTFDLSIELFSHLISSNCHYCGRLPSNRLSVRVDVSKSITYSGIDRSNNRLGYTPENSVPCCKKCNRGKMGDTTNEFIEWVLQTADHIRATGLDKEILGI